MYSVLVSHNIHLYASATLIHIHLALSIIITYTTRDGPILMILLLPTSTIIPLPTRRRDHVKQATILHIM